MVVVVVLMQFFGVKQNELTLKGIFLEVGEFNGFYVVFSAWLFQLLRLFPLPICRKVRQICCMLFGY